MSAQRIPTRSDVFRPKLPVDPFPDMDQSRPWTINSSCLKSVSSSRVVLLLGSPNQADLNPLLHSPVLENSLLLIATHSPSSFPTRDAAYCSVRILRTLEPLDIENSGAVRLVSILQRAERVAAEWRVSGNASEQFSQYSESTLGGDFEVSEPFGHCPKPTTSGEVASPGAQTTSRSFSMFGLFSPKSSKSSRNRFSEPGRNLDAIIHYIPPSLPEKTILRLTVLVTTLSHSFLIPTLAASFMTGSTPSSLRPSPASSRSPSIVDGKTGHLRGTINGVPTRKAMLKRSSIHSAPVIGGDIYLEQQNGERAHIIHVLPESYGNMDRMTKLMSRIDDFLVAFAYPSLRSLVDPARPSSPQSLSSRSSIRSSRSSLYSIPDFSNLALASGGIEKPIPYITSAKILSSAPKAVNAENDKRVLTIADLIVLGALDSYEESRVYQRTSTLLDGLVQGGWHAWIRSDTNLVLDTPSPSGEEGSEYMGLKEEPPLMHRGKEDVSAQNALPTPPESSEGSGEAESSGMGARTSSEPEPKTAHNQTRRASTGGMKPKMLQRLRRWVGR